MSRKKQATMAENQAVEKPPIELSDDQLDAVQGGISAETVRPAPLVRKWLPDPRIEIPWKLRVKFALDTNRYSRPPDDSE